MTTPTPTFNSLFAITSKDTQLEDLPDSPAPYFIGTKDGLFLHYRLGDLGRGLIRTYTPPKSWGTTTEQFIFDSDPVPADICARILSFFRRIFETKHAEAEVLLLRHRETKDWKVFVPTQLVSHGGVTSVYHPNHIPAGYLVVGTMHSHCDFSAFHSGTDQADADGMNGLHLTLGHVNADTPSIAAMVAINKRKFHYDDISIVADFSQLDAATAPEWWDRYVGSEQDKPVGYHLFEMFGRSTTIKTHVKTKPASQWTPTPKTNGAVIPYRPAAPSHSLSMTSDDWEAYLMARYGETSYDAFDAEDYISRLVTGNGWTKPKTAEDLLKLPEPETIGSNKYWEESLGHDKVASILECGAIHEGDFEDALDAPEESCEPEWWTDLMVKKVFQLAGALEDFGIHLNIEMTGDHA